jgi:hypothetical protein
MVVLGASNLALSLPTVVSTARAMLGPLHILATPGHGRSYGLSTQFFWRRLPGIVSCGLWDELARQPGTPTVALLTDIGNDLVYGVPVRQIVDWIESCLERLDALGAKVVVTSLPLESLRRTPHYRVRLLRRLLFPSSRTPVPTMLDQADELCDKIEALGRQQSRTIVGLPGNWYGLDPIHICRSKRPEAWSTILAPLAEGVLGRPLPAATRMKRKQWRRLRPHERTVFGRVQSHRQPAVRLPDGTTLSLY